MLFKYCKDLAKHTLNIHSAISFALIFVAPFLPVSSPIQTVLVVFFAILAILIGSYYSWRDLYKKTEVGSLEIFSEYSSFGCGSVNGLGMINKFSSLIYYIDFVNNTDQPQVVKKFLGASIKGGSTLFQSEVDKILSREADDPHKEVSLPIKIAPKDRRMFRVSIDIPVVETNSEDLPMILSKLEKIEVTLLFSISSQNGENKEKEVFLEVDTREYVKEIVEIWKQYGCPELYESYCNKTA